MAVVIREIEANTMRFRCREAGSGGEPVMLLHGFPETSHMWLPLLQRLEAEGFHALAPDQRGYSPGARPQGSVNYDYAAIASDVFALADAMGWERFHLVGHDWGAGAGWSALAVEPSRIASWTALSVPHLGVLGEAIRNDPDQAERSAYITFFREPGAAEAAFSAGDCELLKRVWAESGDAENADYLEVFSQPGALTAALDWYRGTRGIDPHDEKVRFGPTGTPTLLIWGNRDTAIGRAVVEASHHQMRGPYRFVELDAGHWLIQEARERVIDEILGMLQANPCSLT